jgi:hypothetical protein
MQATDGRGVLTSRVAARVSCRTPGLRFPAEHRHRIRHSYFIERIFYFIERIFGESRRPCQGHRPAARRDQLPHPRLGRSRPPVPRLTRPDRGRRRPAGATGPVPLAAAPSLFTPDSGRHHSVTPGTRFSEISASVLSH